MISLPLKFQSFRIAVMYNHVFFESFVYLSLIFWLEPETSTLYLYILPKLERPVRCKYFSA